MHYRPINADEFEEFWALDAYAFREQYPLSRYTPEFKQHLRGLFVNGQKVAQLQIIPLIMQIDGKDAEVGIIGSVATPAEQRRRGYTEELLRQACLEMYERGMILSALHPFRYSYYGRFGWAACVERRVYSGEPKLFRRFKHLPGGFVPATEADIPELDAIYRDALRGRVGPIVRDAAWWRSEIFYNWANERAFGHIWRDEHGRGRSYLFYRYVKSDKGGWDLVCREIVARDPVARSQLFALLADQDSQAERIIFRAPSDAPVNALFADPLECRIEPSVMLRIIDAEKALREFAYPTKVHGEFTLRISDEWIAANHAAFRVSIANGRASVERLPADAAVGIECSVQVLAQLYSRALRPRTAATFGVLPVHDKQQLNVLDQAFNGLAPFCSDYF